MQRFGCRRALRRPCREGDLRELREHLTSAVELAAEFASQRLAGAQTFAQILITVAHRHLQAGDRPLGDFGRGDQLRYRAFQRLLVGFELFQPPIEYDAEGDREQQQHRHQALDHQAKSVAHCASTRFEDWSAISNMANVVFGLRSGLTTRTATLSPTRPMRPSVSATSPQRTVT